jgi:hypothetical protein
MFSNKAALAGLSALFALSFLASAHAQDKHLTLEDIDGIARQNLVDSMRKGAAQSQPTSTGLAGGLPSVATAPAASDPAPSLKKPPRFAAPPKNVTPVSFVGAYSDMSGTYVLYDYQGAIYPARQGTTLINGWTVTRVDGYQVSVEYAKRKWTDVITAPVRAMPAFDTGPVRAVTDLGGPLPPASSFAGQPVVLPIGVK